MILFEYIEAVGCKELDELYCICLSYLGASDDYVHEILGIMMLWKLLDTNVVEIRQQGPNTK